MSMKTYNVVFTTYEEYKIEADSEQDAINQAYEKFTSDRRRSTANLHYDELEVEEQETGEDYGT